MAANVKARLPGTVLLVIVQFLLHSLRNVLRRRLTAREARKRAAVQLEPAPSAADWEQVPTDAEWTEDNDWTEDDESTADDDPATAAADVDPVPAEISFPESPPPPAEVATGAHDVGIGDAPAPADPRTSPSETHWRAPAVDRPNGAGSGNGDRSASPAPRGGPGDTPTGGASRGGSSK